MSFATGGSDGQYPGAPDIAERTLEPQFVNCRRCGKQVAASLPVCPFCAARIVPVAGSQPARSTISGVTDWNESGKAVARLLVFYGLILATNVAGACYINSIEEQRSEQHGRDEATAIVLALEGVDTAVVVIALFAISRPPKIGTYDFKTRLRGWIAGPIILLALLGLNYGYHALLESYIQFPHWALPRYRERLVLAVVSTCIQPAIIEELFFRYIALGTLTRVMSIPAALVVSSVMFGVAHSWVLLSIPILTIVGMGFGLVRVWSGSLLLPMLLHGLHNAVIMFVERQS